MIETILEKVMWKARWIVILAVIFSLVGSILLFVVASLDIYNIVVENISNLINHIHPENFHDTIISVIIGAVDFYLIAVVLLIFSFGLYELFIAEISNIKNRDNLQLKVLRIESLDQLKDKLAKVIIMVLVVSFFKKILYTPFTTPLEMLYFALSIITLVGGLFILQKVGDKH